MTAHTTEVTVSMTILKKIGSVILIAAFLAVMVKLSWEGEKWKYRKITEELQHEEHTQAQ